jgi:hypothetical protein
MKNLIYKIAWFFCLPTIILHELSHVIMCLIFGKAVTGFDYKITNEPNFSASVWIIFKEGRKLLPIIIIAIAPLFSLVFILLMASFGLLPIYITIYFLLTAKCLLPSKADYKEINNFKEKLNRNFETSDEDFIEYLKTL